jgi:hypothetical protein
LFLHCLRDADPKALRAGEDRRDLVLIDGKARTLKARRRQIAGYASVGEIHQHQTGVGPACDYAHPGIA